VKLEHARFGSHKHARPKDDPKLQQLSANEYDDREQRDYEQNRSRRAAFRKSK
jgi:hypothetical protein